MSLDGFNPNPSFASTLGGIQPAFYLQNGFPAYSTGENINSGADNGVATPLYRPKDANRLSNSQQWNFTIERRLGGDSLVSIAYVASKGTRLPPLSGRLTFSIPRCFRWATSSTINSRRPTQ